MNNITTISRNIKIEKVKDVYAFVQEATKTGRVKVTRGDFSVQGSSMMGMFAIDPSEPFTVEYDSDNVEFNSFIHQFEV